MFMWHAGVTAKSANSENSHVKEVYRYMYHVRPPPS